MIKQLSDPGNFKLKALQWASTFEVCAYLDSNNFSDQYSRINALLAVGIRQEVVAEAGEAFNALAQFRKDNPGWITGFFGYDLKNETEHLISENIDGLHFPDLYFFSPLHLLEFHANHVEIISDQPGSILDHINSWQLASPQKSAAPVIKQRFTKPEYLDTVNRIKEHIKRGDIYVTNFCQEFYADDAAIDPIAIFTQLNSVSPNPFSAFFKWHSKYILCASPERFLAKRGHKLISQPIKGTAKRGKTEQDDNLIKDQLKITGKELQENVMIVDLVRNDLTRSAKPGSVNTEELFGIYSFKQLHQMISTVTCQLDENVSTVQVIKNSFPMGSMTGAPKLKAMQLMEQFERSRRGVYSGAVGYFDPEDDFDFNVVIRAVQYDAVSNYLSFQAGSAITYHADAAQEYDECLLKVKAIMEVLGAGSKN